MNGATVFTGAAVFDGDTLHDGAALVVRDGRVEALMPDGSIREADGAADVRRLDGGVLAPGLIDLQVNGGGGMMLADAATVAGIAAICAAHGRLGATGILPTLITDTAEATRAAVAAGIAAARAGVPGFLGLHLEGPHLDPARKGAHDPALIRTMTDADLAHYRSAAAALPTLMITLAPESAAPGQIAALAAAGVVVSLGHSDTGIAGARAAIAAGARSVTHLYNAMSPLGHREPGLVGAALDAPEVFAGIIADGVHVGPEALRVAVAAKRGAARLYLVTDAMAVAGTALAEFSLGGRRILRRDGRLTLGDGTLAGADCDLPRCLAHLRATTGLPLAAVLAMATAVPAACIGRDDIGHLRPGAMADMVHLGDDLALREVWRHGAAP